MLQVRSSPRAHASSMVMCRCIGKSGFTVTVHDLPDIMLMQIFNHLSLYDLCRISRVCRRWLILSHDSTLWKFVDLSKYKNINTETISALIQDRFSPFMRFLDLSNCPISTAVLRALSTKCRSLESIKLSNSVWDKGLVTEVCLPQRLQFFDLRNFAGDFDILGQLLNGLRTVKCLKFFGYGNFLPHVIAFSAFKLQVLSLQNLLVLEICDTEDVGDGFLLQIAENIPLLKGLCLRRCPRVRGTTLATVLNLLENLCTFTLFRTGVIDEYLTAPSWENLRIEELDLSANDNLTYHSLLEILPKLPSLKYLSLNNCGRGHALNDEVEAVISQSNCWRSLETISLQFCKRINGHSLEVLFSPCKLKYISFRSSHLISFDDMARVVHCFPLLQHLEVGALFSLDETGKGWDNLIIQLGKHCPLLEKLILVKCNNPPRWKIKELKAAICSFVTKCTRLRQICVLYSEATITDLFEFVLARSKRKSARERVKITSQSAEEVIPPPKNSLNNYLQHLYGCCSR